MKCPECNGEIVEYKVIYEEFRRNNRIVLMPVTVPVCRICGQRVYDPTSYKELGIIANKYIA